MSNSENVPDRIKNRILKLKELAKRGYKGEAIAAQRALSGLLGKYNLTIEDLYDESPEWRMIKTGRGKDYKAILFQCYYKIMEKSDVKYKESKGLNEIWLELTNAQYADLMSLFEFHKAQFKKERDKLLKNLCMAYVRKHEIWSEKGHRDRDKEPDREPMDLDTLRSILALVDSMEDVSYYKQLEGI